VKTCERFNAIKLIKKIVRYHLAFTHFNLANISVGTFYRLKVNFIYIHCRARNSLRYKDFTPISPQGECCETRVKRHGRL